MIGIYDCFGYGPGYDVTFEERYRLIKESGFDCVMLWWSDKFGRGAGYKQDAWFARDAGLIVENIHVPIHEQNYLSMNNLDGESVFQTYMQCLDDCFEYGIPTMVIHLPDDAYLLNDLGLKRLSMLVSEAEEKKVTLAFENLRNISNLTRVMQTFHSQYVGYCYDSCHHKNYASDIDLLEQYGDRLVALHLHDNGGKHNQHQLPFDGSINWSTVMKGIERTGYQGAISLEPMNWDYEHLSIRDYLILSAQRAKRLDNMRIS